MLSSWEKYNWKEGQTAVGMNVNICMSNSDGSARSVMSGQEGSENSLLNAFLGSRRDRTTVQQTSLLGCM